MSYEISLVKAIKSGNIKGVESLDVTKETVDEIIISNLEYPQNHGISKFISIRYPTPLVYAICCEQIEIVKYLIHVGADLNHVVSNWRPIHFASVSQKAEIIKTIIEKDKTQINAFINGTSSTPLHIAVSSNNLIGTLTLLKLGADVNIKNSDNNSAIHLASITTDKRIIDALIAYGAQAEERNSIGQTPEEIAIKHHKVDNAKLLNDYASGLIQKQSVDDLERDSSCVTDPTADDEDTPAEYDTTTIISDLEERVATLEVILNN